MQFKYLKQLLCLFLMMIVVYVPNVVFASLNKTIIFVPHDNRPISFKQTADNIRDLGYEVLTPPEELLGNRENPYAKPEELSKWVIENAKKAGLHLFGFADASGQTVQVVKEEKKR